MKKTMLAAAFIFAGLSGAQAQTAINMIGFGGGTNLPVWAAIDRGFFEKEGLKVTLDRTHGSKEQIRDLMANKYQFATTASTTSSPTRKGRAARNMTTSISWPLAACIPA
jgi:ABC-type nitrate/sulfonate/bicarbonate transport system substrate-binding protein